MQGATLTSGTADLSRVPVLRSDTALVTLLLLLHAITCWGLLWVYTQSDDVPAVYLASGVSWAAFMLLGRRAQALYAVVAAATQLAGEFLIYEASASLALLFTASKIAGPFIGAQILRGVIGHRGLQATIRDLIWFGIIATVAVPTVAMLLPHLMRAAEFGVGIPWYVTLVLLEAIGIAVMAPLLVFWVQQQRVRISQFRWEPVLILLTTVVLLSLGYFVLPLYGHGHTVFYVTTPVMIWTAARFGMRGATLINLVPTAFMIGTALAGTGPFLNVSVLDVTVIELQLFLLIGSGMTLLLGAYAEAREAAQQQRVIDKRRLQDLSLRLLRSEERYRNNLATRLHDGIGQTLTLARMRLDDVLAPPVTPETLAQRITPIQSALDTAIEQVRDMTRDVATGLYRGEDLAATVNDHLSSVFDGMDIEASVDSDTLPELRHETAVVMSRAIRECLVNVAKHAAATQVRVDLVVERQPAQFVAVITDDGVGLDLGQLDLDASDGSSFGLSSVRNSMLALGGSFDVDAEANAGTRVTLTLPLKYLPTA